MLRALIVRKFRDTHSGREGSTNYTIDFECPELEAELATGGFGESGYDYRGLLGVEVLKRKDNP